MWIVNDITDCKTCLFYVSGLFVLFCFSIVFVRMCVYVSDCLRACVCVYVAVNSYAYYRWIRNDITDFNSCLFSVAVCVFLFWSFMCQMVCACVCLFT